MVGYCLGCGCSRELRGGWCGQCAEDRDSLASRTRNERLKRANAKWRTLREERYDEQRKKL